MRGKLTVYRVRKCGYYAGGKSRCCCCNLHECLSDICNWIQAGNLTIRQTCTFPGDREGTCLPVYCFDAAYDRTGAFMITTWNQTPADRGAVGAVPGDGIAGLSDVETRVFPDKSIPGYPTHFWFLPNHQIVVTVRFDSQPLNGHHGLNLFMRGYLARFSRYVRFEDPTDNKGIFQRNVIGYAPTPDSEDAYLWQPTFKSVLLRRDSEIAYIRKNRTSIHRVIRKGRPSTGGESTRNFLDRTLTAIFGLGAAREERSLPDRTFVFEIPYTPTSSELDQMIREYDPNEDHGSWDDIGFDFRGDSVRRWLSNSTVKVEVDLPDDLRDRPGAVADATALLESLQQHRSKVVV